ncbi:MAG TPA: hypothetical protein PKD09_10610 [Aggregatilinea sp.]|uniref:hypothetical protein n=1 Tax=Aggregatilinea sp. TaxID=2806333 RepID=UPI002BF9B785|nr:hypothetical protein [Aggregatilinea sp.]HML22094.1 hypothetical protein [Aggregatilinea sp.]
MNISKIPKRNTHGFTLRAGQMVLSDSALSAHSGKQLSAGGVRQFVPGLQRGQYTLTYVVGADEFRNMSKRQHERIHDKARKWLEEVLAAANQPVEESAPEGDGELVVTADAAATDPGPDAPVIVDEVTPDAPAVDETPAPTDEPSTKKGK